VDAMGAMHANGPVALHVLRVVPADLVVPNRLPVSLRRGRLGAGRPAQKRVARGRAERDGSRDRPQSQRAQVFPPARKQRGRNDR